MLDEISEMDLRLQAKLLRAIQEREIDRVGGSTPIKVDIRLIATRTAIWRKKSGAKRFREDLYFRLNVVNIELPPLRHRTADILPLAEYFAKKYAAAVWPICRFRIPLSHVCWPITGAATYANWKTPCTAPFFWLAMDRSTQSRSC